MRSLLIVVGILLVVCAADVFGMGKSDGPKKDAEKPLKKEAVAEVAKPAKEPVKVEPAKEPVEAEPVKKPVEKPAKIEPSEATMKPDADKVLVTVNGVAIKSSEVESRLNKSMQMEMSRMTPQTAANFSADAMKALRDRRRKTIIDGFILERLIDQQTKERKIEVTEKDIDGAIEEIMTQNNIASLDKLKEGIGKNGITLEDLRGQLRRRVGLEKLLELEMKAAGEASEATEAEAKEFYDGNPMQFSRPEQVRASHILIKTEGLDDDGKAEAKKKIEDLLKRARVGEDFAELARKHSEDTGSKAKGGEYVFGRKRMVKPFEDAAFSLEIGQISDIVETKFGYHIIKLSEKIPAETTSFEEAKEDIIKNLGNQKMGKYWMTKLQPRLKSEAKLEWSAEEKAKMDKAAKPAVIPPSLK